MLKDDFPRIWVPSWENRDLRQLLWHRHRLVQARTRMLNQLQAVAINEGLRCKKRLWRAGGRQQLESFRLAPWASRRRCDLLQLLDQLNPTITELSQAIEQEAAKCPEARRLMTHPGVGALTALAFVLIITVLWITQLSRTVEKRTAQLETEIRERQRIENQRAMEQERARIAQDIHDDLGARVTQISLLSAVAQGKAHLPEEARADFGKVTQMTRNLVSALYETVWSVNPENDNLEALANYLCQGFTSELEMVGIHCFSDAICEKHQNIPRA